MKYIYLILFVLCLQFGSVQAQQTFVVNSLDDQYDGFPGNGVCLTVQGVCTLRAAIHEANALPNSGSPDVIVFDDIPVTNGIAIIDVVFGQFPDITDPVIIDAESAPGEVILDGNFSAYYGLSLTTGSGGSTIKGMTIGNFAGYSIEVDANNVVVENNYFGISQSGSDYGNNVGGIVISGNNNRVGGINKGNVVANTSFGILVALGSDNLIRGNYVGTDPDFRDAGNIFGITIRSSATATVGGPTRAYGNTIGFNDLGILASSTGDKMRNNYIGTNESGDNLGNTTGVYVEGTDLLVGGSKNHGNVIGFNDVGIHIVASDNKVKGNYIGVNEAGQEIGNGKGIFITNTIDDSADNNHIGYALGATIDPDTDKANTIAYNEEAGILVTYTPLLTFWPRYVTIRGNHIYENGQIGIDLVGGQGPTLNDIDDSDIGANDLVNYPEVARVAHRLGPNEIAIEYSISSDPGIVAYPFTVDVYLADDPVSGEGKTYIGSDTYWNQNTVQEVRFDAGSFTWASTDVLVLTATDAQGNTSEFSPATDEIGGTGNSLAAAPDGSRLEVVSPDAFGLSAPYPNPFSSRSTFTVNLETSSGPVRILLYDLLGREVQSVFEGHLPAGSPTSFDYRWLCPA